MAESSGLRDASTAMEGTIPSEDDSLVRLSTVIAVVAAVVGFVALWLPYTDLGPYSVSLMDTSVGEPDWYLSVLPRLVGTVLVVVPGVVALAVPRYRLALWGLTTGALLGLAGVWAYLAIGSRSYASAAGRPGIAHRLDLLLSVVAVAAAAIGAVAAIRAERAEVARGALRHRATPYMAIGVGVAALVALGLMTRSILFPPSTAFSSESIWASHSHLGLRPLGLALAVLFVTMPVLAALARDTRLTPGLALGWAAYVTVLGAGQPAGGQLPDRSHEMVFLLGASLVAATTAVLLAWAFVDRTPQPWEPTTDARRARTGH